MFPSLECPGIPKMPSSQPHTETQQRIGPSNLDHLTSSIEILLLNFDHPITR